MKMPSGRQRPGSGSEKWGMSCSLATVGSEILVSEQMDGPTLRLVIHVTNLIRTEVVSWLDLYINGAN